MAFDSRRTYLCYNNRDLIRDGFIPPFIQKEYMPPDTFNLNRAKHSPKGTSYAIVKDEDGNVIRVTETKKLLPASKLMIEFDFSKVMKNAVVHPFSPDSLAFSPIASMVAAPILSPIGRGGIAEGLTEMTYHLLDSDTKINQKIVVTKQMIDDKVIIFDGYPLSVFGIVKEATGTTVSNDGTVSVRKFGLDFTSDQLEILGKYSDGAWSGTVRKRIAGATDSNGLFGNIGIAEVKFEDVAKENQEQLFVEVIRDDRKLKFRADNYEASGHKAYPFRIVGPDHLDVTDRQIRINTDDLKVGDIIYITYTIAYNRRVRQTLTHLGKIAQGNTIGIVGFRGAIESKADVFDYRIKSWAVPKLPPVIKMKNIDDIADIDNYQYKLDDGRYRKMRIDESIFPAYDRSTDVDMIEGWRVSEAITDKVSRFWAADYRGIILYEGKTWDTKRGGIVTLMLDRKLIRDQVWFTEYLKSLDFTYPSGANGQYVEADFQKNIEDEIEWQRESGQLFDLSEAANSLLFDREKIPYYKPFAKALTNVSKWVITNDDSGVGIINLDLHDNVDPGFRNHKELFDLSYIEFDRVNAQPNLIASCEEPFDIFPHHYFSQSYDATSDEGGAGAWLDQGVLDREVMLWSPEGGDIESYWKQETPYFCGDFNRKTRVYMERMGGNSLDNYSWIYVNSVPFVPHNISLDMNEYGDDSIILFKDDKLHHGLVYHIIKDVYFYSIIKSFNEDDLQSHIRDPYDYEKYRLKGYNRILGDKQSFSNGKPLTDDIRRICYFGQEKDFWWTEKVFDENSDMGYGLRFDYDVAGNLITPELNIPTDWYIREMTVYYDWKPGLSIEVTNTISLNKNRDIAFYFEGADVSIDNITFGILPYETISTGHNLPLVDRDNIHKIDFAYYPGDKIKFFGKTWENVRIKKIELRLTSPNNPNNNERLDLTDYKLDNGQASIVNDGYGKMLAFHANSDSGNIDVAITGDEGREWGVHSNIIRLVEGETASLPQVIKSFDRRHIHLFFVLNDTFLMYKILNVLDFQYEDAMVEPIIPETYDVGDYDQSLKIPEIEYWGNFSKGGRNIRRNPAYFVAGEGEEEYFVEQNRITADLISDNANISDVDKHQTPRLVFSGNVSQMQGRFEGEAFAAYIDNGGTVRVLITIDNKLSIKRSSDFRAWEYDLKDVEIHKDWADPNVNKGEVIEIRNIQIVKNDFDANLLSLLYFHKNMLFMRHFNTAILYPVYDVNGVKLKSYSEAQLSLTPTSTNKPIFLVGNIPENIRNKKIEEIDNGIPEEDSELLIEIPYTRDEISRFDQRFDVDMDTQVFAYIGAQGLMRVLYKDKLGFLNSLIVDGLDDPTPEVWYVSKGE